MMTLLYDRKWAQLTIKPGGDALKNHRKTVTGDRGIEKIEKTKHPNLISDDIIMTFLVK